MKYETPLDWLYDYLGRLKEPESLHAEAETLAGELDADTIQTLYREEMEKDGYFDEPEPARIWYRYARSDGRAESDTMYTVNAHSGVDRVAKTSDPQVRINVWADNDNTRIEMAGPSFDGDPEWARRFRSVVSIATDMTLAWAAMTPEGLRKELDWRVAQYRASRMKGVK